MEKVFNKKFVKVLFENKYNILVVERKEESAILVFITHDLYHAL